MKPAFSRIHDAREASDKFWLGELSADRKQVRCVVGWQGGSPAPTQWMRQLRVGEELIEEGHPDYGWCCAQLALKTLSEGVTK